MVAMTNIMTPMESTTMVFVGSTWTNIHTMWNELAAW